MIGLYGGVLLYYDAEHKTIENLCFGHRVSKMMKIITTLYLAIWIELIASLQEIYLVNYLSVHQSLFGFASSAYKSAILNKNF